MFEVVNWLVIRPVTERNIGKLVKCESWTKDCRGYRNWKMPIGSHESIWKYFRYDLRIKVLAWKSNGSQSIRDTSNCRGGDLRIVVIIHYAIYLEKVVPTDHHANSTPYDMLLPLAR